MRVGCKELQRLKEVWVTGLKIAAEISSCQVMRKNNLDHYPLQMRSMPAQLSSCTWWCASTSSALCMFQAPHHGVHKGCSRSGKVLRRATRTFKSTEWLLCEAQLWRQESFSLKKKKVLRGNMVDIYKIISDKVKVSRDGFSTVSCSTKTRNWI